MNIVIIDNQKETTKTRSALNSMQQNEHPFVFFSPNTRYRSYVKDRLKYVKTIVFPPYSKNQTLKNSLATGNCVVANNALLTDCNFNADNEELIEAYGYDCYVDDSFFKIEQFELTERNFKSVAESYVNINPQTKKVTWIQYEQDPLQIIDYDYDGQPIYYCDCWTDAEPEDVFSPIERASNADACYCYDDRILILPFSLNNLQHFNTVYIVTSKFCGSELQKLFDAIGVEYDIVNQY